MLSAQGRVQDRGSHHPHIILVSSEKVGVEVGEALHG